MPQNLQIGWIDYGSNDRNRILSVLSLLSGSEAVDELGIGVVRDGFADLLFPGTSTIQTRAKYFFIVPYILMGLEREQGLTPKSLLERLYKEEIALIGVLKKDNAEGVIGGRSGEKLQRKPSNIYWNGLFAYGIFNSRIRLSLDGYARAVCALKREKYLYAVAGHDEKDGGNDDDDAATSNIRGFWRVPLPDQDWRQSVTIDLTPGEARFLRERIIKAEGSKDSLLAYILKHNLSEITAYDDLEAVGKAIELPGGIRDVYEMANRFAGFIYGANIRYNVILSSGQNEDANGEWERWRDEVATSQFIDNYDINEAVNRLVIGGRSRGRLLPFLKKWKGALMAGNIEEMDRLIIDREIELKGRERAKLQNSAAFTYQEGIWLGGGKLQFRFRNARRLIEDIYKGLGDAHA